MLNQLPIPNFPFWYQVRDHARKLLEKYTGEPFFASPYSRMGRMDRSSLDQGMQWLDRHFVLLRCEDDGLPSIDWLLDLARVAVLRYNFSRALYLC